MSFSPSHQSFASLRRVSRSLCNDRCQNILYKSVLEHFKELHHIAALLLTSKSFQNSSFGANFLVNFVADGKAILLLDSALSPSSCFSLQFVPSLHIKQALNYPEKVKSAFSNFFSELVTTKYLHLSLRTFTLENVTTEMLSFFFGISSSNPWPHLQELTLGKCALDDAAVEIISKNAAHLHTLNFSMNWNVTDAGLEHVSKLSGITALSLDGCGNVTDAGLEHIAKLYNITSLSVTFCNISDAGLEHVSKLFNITVLNLSDSNRITDVGLEHLAKLSRITSLNLSNCFKITDAGLHVVSQLANITSLNLRSCDLISDDGLEHLSQLANITSLDLFCCRKITASAKTNFKITLPFCTIRS